MEKNISSLKILNIIVCAIILIAFVLFVGTRKVKAEEIQGSKNMVLPSVNIKLGLNYEPLIKKDGNSVKEEPKKAIVYDLDYYIDKNKDTITFFTKAFGYNLDDVIYDLKTREKENSVFISTNIGYLKDDNGNLKVYDSFEYGLIEYFYDLINNHANLRHQTYEPYNGSADYVEKLIMYYSHIYKNVDPSVMLSIGAAESGYYEVKYMLNYNNVYGGMSSYGLIRHNNIELGVLSYIRMMSKNYYAKGLDTIYEIGYVYCPSYEYGYKSASSHWISLVERAMNKYQNYNQNITINEIINKEEIA
jgi:hypothetical protein